jgi:hypothetical protein
VHTLRLVWRGVLAVRMVLQLGHTVRVGGDPACCSKSAHSAAASCAEGRAHVRPDAIKQNVTKQKQGNVT